MLARGNPANQNTVGRPRTFVERKTLHSGNFGVGSANRSLAKKRFFRAEMERDFMGDRAIHSLGFFSCRLVFVGATDSGFFSRGTISLGHGADGRVARRNSFGSDADRTSRELHCANNRIGPASHCLASHANDAGSGTAPVRRGLFRVDSHGRVVRHATTGKVGNHSVEP